MNVHRIEAMLARWSSTAKEAKRGRSYSPPPRGRSWSACAIQLTLMRRCFALIRAAILMSRRFRASSEARQKEPALMLWCLPIGCVMPMPVTLSIEAVLFTWFKLPWGTPASLRLGVICTRIVRLATSLSE